jgi:hypothetical protein
VLASAISEQEISRELSAVIFQRTKSIIIAVDC